MSTRGYWGIIKNGEEKMVYNHFDSYPDCLGKDVVFLIQNNLEILAKVFEKIIFVKNINNLDYSEAEFILRSPEKLASKRVRKKYFSESAKYYLGQGDLEYGYMIDLDKSVLKLYKDDTIISEMNLDKIKYKDVERAFQDSEE